MGPSMSWDLWPRPVARAAVVTQECTQIGENGLSVPFWGICVHCCDVVDRREDAGVYTNWRKWALDAVSGHLCTLLRRDSPRRQPTLTPEEPQKSRKTRDDPRGAPTKGRPSRGGARPFPGRSVSRTSRMPYRTRLAPHLSYRRGGAHPYCNTHGKPQRAAGAMNVASVHNEASLCSTVTGRSAEAQRNEPERSRRRARSAPIPTGCARVC